MWNLYYASCCGWNQNCWFVSSFNNENDAFNHLISLIGDINEIYNYNSFALNDCDNESDNESDNEIDEDEIYRIYLPKNKINSLECYNLFGKILKCQDHPFPKPFFIIDKVYNNNFIERAARLCITIDALDMYELTEQSN